MGDTRNSRRLFLSQAPHLSHSKSLLSEAPTYFTFKIFLRVDKDLFICSAVLLGFVFCFVETGSRYIVFAILELVV